MNAFEHDLEEFVNKSLTPSPSPEGEGNRKSLPSGGDLEEARKVVCLSAGTAAVHLALLACGVGPGDEVIMPAYTYTASASVVAHVGAKVVLVDV